MTSRGEKIKARSQVMIALNSGRLTKPGQCLSCQNLGLLHAHHEDYARPLDVRWLCVRCHADVHSGGRRLATMIRAKRTTVARLCMMKLHPRETYDSVINRLLDEAFGIAREREQVPAG